MSRRTSVTVALNAVIAPVASEAFEADASLTWQATGQTTAGAGTATVIIEGSNDGGNTWVLIGTLTMVLSITTDTEGLAQNAHWEKVRANLTAISGTDATVTVYMGGPKQ